MTNNFEQFDDIFSKNKNVIEMGGGIDNTPIDTSCTTNSVEDSNNDNGSDEDDEERDISNEVDISNSSPREIVKALDRYIIGQADAKSSVAIAIRNRVRRMRVPLPLRDDILPKNILMIGPTGVGKTEIARRIAQMAKIPFIKVEATKFTEVGYVGRDVDSIIRDLMENAVNLVKNRQKEKFKKTVKKNVKILILNALIGSSDVSDETKKIFLDKLDSGKLDESFIEIEVTDSGNGVMPLDMPGGMQMGMVNLGEAMGKFFGGKKTKKRKVKVKDSWKILINEETNRLIDEESVINEAKELTINSGIVVIDEIDKIASRTEVRGEVNREGVQRDLLPLIEGTSVTTKYGVINTDHILFIASGAFHMSKPSDLLPELQGRFPVRVELKSLDLESIIKILREPESNLLKQYIALMATENVKIEFADDGIERIAQIAISINLNVEDIGARRLHTVMERLLLDISFESAENSGKEFLVDASYVEEKLKELTKENDLSKFIL